EKDAHAGMSCPRATLAQPPLIPCLHNSASPPKLSPCDVVRMRRPSGEKVAESTVQPARTFRRMLCQALSSPRLHTRAVPSFDEVRTRLPSGEKEAEVTASRWPSRAPLRHAPVSLRLHTRAFPLAIPVTIRPPSGEKLAEVTAPSWLSSGKLGGAPWPRFHT